MASQCLCAWEGLAAWPYDEYDQASEFGIGAAGNFVTAQFSKSVLSQLPAIKWKWASLVPTVAPSLSLQQDVQVTLQPEGGLVTPPISRRQRALVVGERSHEERPEWARNEADASLPCPSAATGRLKTWDTSFPSSTWTVEWHPITKPVSQLSPFITSLIHLGLEQRGVQLCWPDSHESLKLVVRFCFPNNFSWLSTGKGTQILTLEYQKKQWHLRNWTNGYIILRCDRCQSCPPLAFALTFSKAEKNCQLSWSMRKNILKISNSTPSQVTTALTSCSSYQGISEVIWFSKKFY